MKHTLILAITLLVLGCKKEEIKPISNEKHFYFYVKSDSINLYENAYIDGGRILPPNVFYRTRFFMSDGYDQFFSKELDYGVSVSIKLPTSLKSYKGYLKTIKDIPNDSCLGGITIKLPELNDYVYFSNQNNNVFIDWNGSDTISGHYKGEVIYKKRKFYIDSCSFRALIKYK